MKRIGLAALLVLSVCAGARAESGREFYQRCLVGDEADRLNCVSFISGFVRAITLFQKLSPAAVPTICMNDDNPIDGFKAWARRHPQELERDRGEALAAAIFDPKSCQQSGLNILR